MNSKRRVLINSFLYTASSMLVKAFNFFLIPIYTVYLSTEQYGIVNLINSFSGVVTYVVAFSLFSAVIRFYVVYKDDNLKLKSFLGTIFTFVFLSGLFFALLGFLLRDYLITWFFEGIGFFPILLIGFSTLVFVSLHTVHQHLLRAMQKGKKLAIANIAVFVVQVILNLIFLVGLNMKAEGILLASLIVNILYFIYIIIDLTRQKLFKITLNFRLLAESLKYSIPIMPHDLSTQIASFASKVVLKNNESVSEVGIYSLANQFTSIIDLIQSTVNSAFQPWFFENMTHNNSERTREIIDFSYVLLVLYSIMYLLIGLFSQEAVMIMAEGSYVKAWTVIPILIVGFSIKSIYYFHVNIMLFNKKASKVLFIATISGSIIDIILAFLLVPYLGMYGSALAFGIAKIIVVVLVVILSRRFDSLRYNIIKMLSIIIPSLLFMAAGLFFSYTKYIYEFNWLNLSYKFVILFLYLLFVYLTNFKRINAAIIKIRQRKDRRKL